MDNNLSSMLYALNNYRQSTKIDKDTLLAGNIKVYFAQDADANTSLVNATNSLKTDLPNPNTYQLLDVNVFSNNGGNYYSIIIVRYNG